MQFALFLLFIGAVTAADLLEETTKLLENILGNEDVAKRVSSVVKTNPALSADDTAQMTVEESVILPKNSTSSKPESDVLTIVLGPLFLGYCLRSKNLDEALQKHLNVSMKGRMSGEAAKIFLDSLEKVHSPSTTTIVQYNLSKSQLIASVEQIANGCTEVRLESIELQFNIYLSILFGIDVQVTGVDGALKWNVTMDYLVKNLGEYFYQINIDKIIKLSEEYQLLLNHSNCIPCGTIYLPGDTTGICTRTNLLFNISNPSFVKILVKHNLLVDLLAQVTACKQSSNVPQCLSYVIVAFENKIDFILYGQNSTEQSTTTAVPEIVYNETDVTKEERENVLKHTYRIARGNIAQTPSKTQSATVYRLNHRYSDIFAQFPKATKDSSLGINFCALKPDGLTEKFTKACQLVGIVFQPDFLNVTTTTDLSDPNIRGYCSQIKSDYCGSTEEVRYFVRTVDNSKEKNIADGVTVIYSSSDKFVGSFERFGQFCYMWNMKYCTKDYDGQ